MQGPRSFLSWHLRKGRCPVENVMVWETKNVLVLLAAITAVFFVALWLAGQNFSCKVCDVILTIFQ